MEIVSNSFFFVVCLNYFSINGKTTKTKKPKKEKKNKIKVKIVGTRIPIGEKCRPSMRDQILSNFKSLVSSRTQAVKYSLLLHKHAKRAYYMSILLYMKINGD